MNFKNAFMFKQPILILGDTGTGKSVLARKLHRENSESKNFIQLNINSINSNLFESELFGHTKGAYTGATGEKRGFCEDVGDGTLFIDEIGDLPIESQTKLLTLLDERIYYRVGCTKLRKFYGSLIFATNVDLMSKVKKGKFRKDLFYRLRFYQVELKPIKDNPNLKKIILDKIESRAEYFRRVLSLDRLALEKLCSYDWPGNLRELSNTIDYLYGHEKNLIRKSDLPDWIKSKNTITMHRGGNYSMELEQFEKTYLMQIMRKSQGKIVKAVEYSGLSKPTIISKLRKYGISRTDFKNLKEVDEAYGF